MARNEEEKRIERKSTRGCMGGCGLFGLIGIVVFLIIMFFVGKGWYNKMVAKDEVVKNAWANVQTVYQQRYDLVDNLVETVRGAKNFEKETLTDVIKARASATQMTIDADDLTPEKMAELQAQQGQLGSAIGRLLMVTENYPDLKSNQNFLQLSADLKSLEADIRPAREKYNGTVQEFNTYVRSFPRNIIAGWFDFDPKTPFEADPGAEKAPKVNFE